MSLYDYKKSQEISKEDPPFASLIMAASRKADSKNFRILQLSFPEIMAEMQARYDSPGGVLDGDDNVRR